MLAPIPRRKAKQHDELCFERGARSLDNQRQGFARNLDATYPLDVMSGCNEVVSPYWRMTHFYQMMVARESHLQSG